MYPVILNEHKIHIVLVAVFFYLRYFKLIPYFVWKLFILFKIVMDLTVCICSAAATLKFLKENDSYFGGKKM